MSAEDLLTVAQASKKFPVFTEAAIRNLISKSNQNGLAKAIRRVGKRIFILESAFRLWLGVDGGMNNE